MAAFLAEGNAGRIVLAGGESEESWHSLLTGFFPEGYQIGTLGRIALWRLPSMTAEWLKTFDLVLCRISQSNPWSIHSAYEFDALFRVEQILPLDGTFEHVIDSIPDGNTRRKAHRVMRAGYTVRFSHSLEDLRYFYEEMYRPTVLARHGAEAELQDMDAANAMNKVS